MCPEAATTQLPPVEEDPISLPCPTPQELDALGSGMVYEGDPIVPDGIGFDIFTIGPPDWTPTVLADELVFEGHPTWSPDGARITWSEHRDDAGLEADLMDARADGTDRTQLTDLPGREDYPFWTSDGLTYLSGDQRLLLQPDGTAELYRRVPRSGRFAELTRKLQDTLAHDHEWKKALGQSAGAGLSTGQEAQVRGYEIVVGGPVG